MRERGRRKINKIFRIIYTHNTNYKVFSLTWFTLSYSLPSLSLGVLKVTRSTLPYPALSYSTLPCHTPPCLTLPRHTLPNPIPHCPTLPRPIAKQSTVCPLNPRPTPPTRPPPCQDALHPKKQGWAGGEGRSGRWRWYSLEVEFVWHVLVPPLSLYYWILYICFDPFTYIYWFLFILERFFLNFS